jgi:hypothetical protein
MSPPNRRWLRWIAAYVALVSALAGPTMAFYLSASDAHKPLVIRFPVALIVAVAFIHIHGNIRRALDRAPASEFEQALHPAPAAPKVDPFFLKLRENLKNSIVSWGYFEHVMWPRLLALADRRGSTQPLERPSRNWLPRRGPSLRAIDSLITHLERRS